ncbi:MAG: type II toxin-antitoxin system HicB family antitoxin [Hormoscilla sp.]
MDFYTVVLSQSASYWVALCLENGIVGQGITQADAISKLQEAIESFQEVYESEDNIYLAPVPIKELHEFLTLEQQEPTQQTYELRAIHA